MQQAVKSQGEVQLGVEGITVRHFSSRFGYVEGVGMSLAGGV